MPVRFQPLRPKVMKVSGHWFIMVPNFVFGDVASGNSHGPFADWEMARQAAVALSSALHRGLCVAHTAPMVIGMVN